MTLNFDKLKEGLKKYTPEVLTVAALSINTGIGLQIQRMKPKIYLDLYKATNNEYYLVKYYQLTKPNNWLKLHGYTMRRNH